MTIKPNSHDNRKQIRPTTSDVDPMMSDEYPMTPHANPMTPDGQSQQKRLLLLPVPTHNSIASYPRRNYNISLFTGNTMEITFPP